MTGRIVPAADHDDSYAITTMASALSRSITERILNQEPSSYTRGTVHMVGRFSSALIAYAHSEPGKFERVKELILDEFAKYSQGDIPELYIQDAKEQQRNDFILSNATTMDIAITALNFWLLGDIHAMNSHLSRISALTVHQVRDAGRKYVRLDDLLTATIGNLDQ